MHVTKAFKCVLTFEMFSVCTIYTIGMYNKKKGSIFPTGFIVNKTPNQEHIQDELASQQMFCLPAYNRSIVQTQTASRPFCGL